MEPPNTHQPRLLTPEEVARVVRLFREEFVWTQETLAELSGLTPRTIQRLEAGTPSGLVTRRAVARAFGFEEIDWLSKPLPIPTGEEVRAQREAFERNHLVLEAKLVDGRGLMATMIDVGCDSLAATGLSELPEGAREAFAEMLDFTRDCMDIVDAAPRSELLGYGDQLKAMAAPLRDAGFCLAVAIRSTRITKPGWTSPMSMSIVYLVTAPAAQPPSKIAVARKIEFGRMLGLSGLLAGQLSSNQDIHTACSLKMAFIWTMSVFGHYGEADVAGSGGCFDPTREDGTNRRGG